MDSVTIGQYISGGISTEFIKAAFLFLFFAFVTSKWLQFATRSKGSKRTPEGSSFTFWWKDNYNSVVSFLLLSFPLIVFTEDIVHWVGLNALPDALKSSNPMWVYYVIGLLFGTILEGVLKRMKLIRSASKDES